MKWSKSGIHLSLYLFFLFCLLQGEREFLGYHKTINVTVDRQGGTAFNAVWRVVLELMLMTFGITGKLQRSDWVFALWSDETLKFSCSFVGKEGRKWNGRNSFDQSLPIWMNKKSTDIAKRVTNYYYYSSFLIQFMSTYLNSSQ